MAMRFLHDLSWSIQCYIDIVVWSKQKSYDAMIMLYGFSTCSTNLNNKDFI